MALGTRDTGIRKGHCERSSLLEKDPEKSTHEDDIAYILTTRTRFLSKTRQFVIMSACFYMNTITFGLAIALGVIYVELISAFGAPRSQAALVQSIYMGLMIGGGVVFTKPISKFGPGLLTILGSFLATVGMLLGSQATNIILVIVCIGGLSGLGMSILFLGSFIAISQTFGDHRKIALAVLTTASTIGQSTFPFICDALLREFGWSGALVIMGGLTFEGMVCGLLLHTSKDFLNKQTGATPTVQRSRCTWLVDYKLVLLIIFALLFALTGPVEQWFVVDLAVLRGYTRQTGSFLLSMVGALGFVGRILTVLLLRCFKNVSAIWHMTYGFLLFGLGHFLVIWIKDISGMFSGIIVRGIGAGIVVAVQPSLHLEMRGLQLYSQTVAIYNLALGVGQVGGGYIGGVIADLSGGYDLMFYISTAGSVLASVMAFFLWFFGVRKTQAIKNGLNDYGHIAEDARDVDIRKTCASESSFMS